MFQFHPCPIPPTALPLNLTHNLPVLLLPHATILLVYKLSVPRPCVPFLTILVPYGEQLLPHRLPEYWRMSSPAVSSYLFKMSPTVKCHINRQTQLCRYNILVLYSALLHVSTVYISRYQGRYRYTQRINKGRGYF